MTATPEPNELIDVVLVCMPYGDLVRPSLALSLIQAHLERSSIRTKTIYANFDFAERIGPTTYVLVSGLNDEYYLPDWTFNQTIFPHDPKEDERYFHRAMSDLLSQLLMAENKEIAKSITDTIRNVPEAAESFAKDLADRILAMKPRIVGCTSTFLQHIPSLALLKLIHEKDPSIITVMGGTNCDGQIGEATHRCFPWVDYIVTGEADEFIAPLFKKILEKGRDLAEGELPRSVKGPVHRKPRCHPGGERAYSPDSIFARDLDALPIPEYRDYFAALERFRFKSMVIPGLLVESSRGCWWGSKNRCTFCGATNLGDGYRSKSPARFIAEIDALEKKYGVHRFEASDDILNMDYFSSVIPFLKNDQRRRTFFYEAKSNLRRTHIEALKSAGCIWIQPGIESLDSRVLGMMNKGVLAWQNIRLLKLAREFGIYLSWNFLWGFPGEKDEWYDSMANWMPLLEHLQPPNALTRIKIQRYSEYFEHPSRYGLQLRSLTAMKQVYRLPEKDVQDLSYSFQPEGWYDPFRDPSEKIVSERPGIMRLNGIIWQWKFFFNKGLSVLTVKDDGEALHVVDTRSCSGYNIYSLRGMAKLPSLACEETPHDSDYSLEGPERLLYLACEEMPHKKDLPSLLAKKYGENVPPSRIEMAMECLTEKKLILEADDRLIALGLPDRMPEVPTLKDFPGGFLDLRRKD